MSIHTCTSPLHCIILIYSVSDCLRQFLKVLLCKWLAVKVEIINRIRTFYLQYINNESIILNKAKIINKI